MEPQAGQPVAEAGVPLGQAPAAVIMVHGRNAGPANILDLVPRLGRPDLTYLAPAAANPTTASRIRLLRIFTYPKTKTNRPSSITAGSFQLFKSKQFTTGIEAAASWCAGRFAFF